MYRMPSVCHSASHWLYNLKEADHVMSSYSSYSSGIVRIFFKKSQNRKGKLLNGRRFVKMVHPI